MNASLPTALLAALLGHAPVFAADWPIGVDRDLSFLVPGQTDYDEVVRRWGTRDIPGSTEWDWALNVCIRSEVEIYEAYPDLLPANTYVQPPKLPESLRGVSVYSIYDVPDANPASLATRSLWLFQYRRFHTMEREDTNGRLKIHLFFTREGGATDGGPAKLLYFVVDLTDEESDDWDEIAAAEGEPRISRYRYRDYRGEELLDEYPVEFRSYPARGVGYAYHAEGWLQTKIHFEPK